MRKTQTALVDSFVRPMFNAKQRTLDHYVIGIELLDVPHPVYRELSVPSDIYLNYLEEILVMAMGWADYHLTEIVSGELTYCSKQNLQMYTNDSLVEKMRDDSLFTLRDVMKKVGDSFTLVYDFGDSWKHEVTLLEKEKYAEHYADDPGVEVLSGEGCCPPDDCGGSSGYAEMLRTLQFGTDEERKCMEDWLTIWGIEKYDVREFSLRAAKNRIADFQRTLESVRHGLYGDGI